MSKITKKSSSIRRAVGLISPLGPLNSLKKTINSGSATIRDLHREIRSKATQSGTRNETFAEAMARRPNDALPLAEIERSNLNAQRVALLFFLLSIAFTAGSAIPIEAGANFFGILHGALFSALSLLIAVRHSYRVWQIRQRRLVSFKAYIKQPGWLLRALDPELL